MINLVFEEKTGFGGWLLPVAVILIILLVVTSCAGVCLIDRRIRQAGVGYVLLGVVVTAGSIWE